MTEKQPSTIESIVNATNKLNELPTKVKQFLTVGAIGGMLYVGAHINASEPTEAHYWTSPEVPLRSATYQSATQQPTTISVNANTRQSVTPIQNTMSQATVPKTQRNLLSPITRNGIISGTIDYVVEDNGKVILDDSQIYLASEKNPTERWVPFLENGKIQGHYVGTDDDLIIGLSGEQGIYADEDHQVLRSTEGNSNNELYALGIFAALAAGYGISKLPKRKTAEKETKQ